MLKSSSYWPVGIALTLFVFVAFLIITLVVASGEPVNLVDEGYYHQAVNFQEHIDKMQRTAEAEFRIHVKESDNGLVSLHFDGPADQEQPEGMITLFRPADSKQDRQFVLQLSSTGTQDIPTINLSRGLWQVKVDYQWKGDSYYVQAPITVAAGS